MGRLIIEQIALNGPSFFVTHRFFKHVNDVGLPFLYTSDSILHLILVKSVKMGPLPTCWGHSVVFTVKISY